MAGKEENVDAEVKKLIRSIKFNKGEVALRQTNIEYNEEISSKLKELSSPSLSTMQRNELEEDKMSHEKWIRRYKSSIADYENIIIADEQSLGGRGDEKAQAHFEEVMQKMIALKEGLSAILGWCGAGKTHLVALALKKPPPGIWVSTPCAGAPIRATQDISITEGMEYFKELSTLQYLHAMLKFGKDACSQSPSSSGMPESATASRIPLSSIDKRFIGALQASVGDAISLDGKVVARLLDCGGQPQFLEILPRFIGGMSLGILVINLSKRLDEHLYSYFCGEDGKPIGEGVKSSMTNEHMIRLFLQVIVSQSSGDRKTKFMIVGTHRDEEDKSTGETRAQKEEKIKNIISTSGLEDHVIYTDESFTNVIFCVNAKDREDADVALGQRIMKEIMNEKRAHEVTIPLKHLNLELTLKDLCTPKKIFVTVAEACSLMTRYYKSPSSLKEGLEFLSKSFRIFFFSELELVCGEPQILLNLITKIVVRHIELSTNPNKVCTSGEWKRFRDQGIFGSQILKDFLAKDCVDSIVENILEVLKLLLIICEVGEGKYLMPCLLATTTSFPRGSTSMCLYFQSGFTRFGIVCSTVCKLVSSYKWKIRLDRSVHRNSFHFDIPHGSGIVILNDSFDCFIEVVLDDTSEHRTSKLKKICDNLMKAINEVTSELRYAPDPPEIAFLCECPHDPVLDPHVAEYKHEEEDEDFLMCTKTHKEMKLTKNNQQWVQVDKEVKESSIGKLSEPENKKQQTKTHEVVELTKNNGPQIQASANDTSASSMVNTLSSKSTANPLTIGQLKVLRWTDSQHQLQKLHLINEMSPDWKSASDLLGLTVAHTRRIEMDYRTVRECCREVMAEWLNCEDGTYKYSTSWEGLCQLLEDLELSTLAEKLREEILPNLNN